MEVMQHDPPHDEHDGETPTEDDMGYEQAEPGRRGDGVMTYQEEKERRASIKNILADETLSPMAKRRSIQHLMDGRRASLSNASVVSKSSADYDDDDEEDEANIDRGYDTVLVICNEQTKQGEMCRPACNHYERNCSIISPCCGAIFGCRICHDDCPNLPPELPKKSGMNRSASLPSGFVSMKPPPLVPEDTQHNIDRFAIQEVICRQCYTRQPAKVNQCVSCGVQFGRYHCSICNLWMSDEERPYHCHDCGFCRVGGAENFKHCHACGMCIDKTLFEGHNCKVDKYRANCPVCQEFLFSSRSASHEMPCGHAIHWECFRELAKHDSRCPICKKTAETRERMLPTWEAMAAGVALQPVPPELARVVDISCNDCEKSATGRAWHFLGVQCGNCSSFNTVVDRIVMHGIEAHEFLEMNGIIKKAPQNERPRRRFNRRRSAF